MTFKFCFLRGKGLRCQFKVRKNRKKFPVFVDDAGAVQGGAAFPTTRPYSIWLREHFARRRASAAFRRGRGAGRRQAGRQVEEVRKGLLRRGPQGGREGRRSARASVSRTEATSRSPFPVMVRPSIEDWVSSPLRHW